MAVALVVGGEGVLALNRFGRSGSRMWVCSRQTEQRLVETGQIS